jgi:hypothetical protein
MSDIDLERIKAYCEKATPIPWEWIRWPCESMEPALEWVKLSIEKGKGFALQGVGGRDSDEVTVCLTGNGPKSEANALFMVMARQDLPALVEALSSSGAKVEELTRELANLRQTKSAMHDCLVRERDSLRAQVEAARERIRVLYEATSLGRLALEDLRREWDGEPGTWSESHDRLMELMRNALIGPASSLPAPAKDPREALKEAVILPTRFPQLFTGKRKPWKVTRLAVGGLSPAAEDWWRKRTPAQRALKIEVWAAMG